MDHQDWKPVIFKKSQQQLKKEGKLKYSKIKSNKHPNSNNHITNLKKLDGDEKLLTEDIADDALNAMRFLDFGYSATIIFFTFILLLIFSLLGYLILSRSRNIFFPEI